MFTKLYCLGFPSSATPIMEGIIDLHNHIMFYLLIILIFVLYIFIVSLWDFYRPFVSPLLEVDLEMRDYIFACRKLTHGTFLEIFWTVTPSVILMFIAIPSFSLLYAMDEIIDPRVTVKAIGHQWYWSYEFSDNSYSDTIDNFDSYMLPTTELVVGQLRLLEVDNALVLPSLTHIRLIVTATDVLHSWTIPGFGVKIDAVPGRLNQVSLFIKREGVFYGSCSELCGVNHGFMPICVAVVTKENFV